MLLAEQILVLFCIGFVGFITVKLGVFESRDSRVLSNMIVYICSPCVIVDAFQIDYAPEKLKGLMLAGLGAVIVHMLLIGGSRLLSGPLGLNAIEKASIAYSNAGNLIVPLVTAVLGREWVFYTTAYMMLQTILIWTHGQSVIRQEPERDVKKILTNPNILAIVIGLLMFVLKLHFPTPIADCVSGLGQMVGPAGMLVIGMLIADVNLKWVFGQKRPYFICFLRLAAFPAVLVLIFCLSGMLRLHQDAKYILLVVLLAASAPAAVMVTQLAQIHNKDSKYASVINVMSVIFCIVTMPLMVVFYEYLS